MPETIVIMRLSLSLMNMGRSIAKIRSGFIATIQRRGRGSDRRCQRMLPRGRRFIFGSAIAARQPKPAPATPAVRNAGGKVVGVLVVDVTLGALSDHLKILAIRRNAHAFIIDNSGLLIAASVGQVNSADGQRLSLATSGSPAARAVSSIFAAGNRPAPIIGISRVKYLNEAARAIDGAHALLWHRLATGDSASSRIKKPAAAAAAVGRGVALGLYLSRRISDPLVQLSEHVVKVGEGNFDARITLAQASELRNLSDQLNQMAGGLKQRMAYRAFAGGCTAGAAGTFAGGNSRHAGAANRRMLQILRCNRRGLLRFHRDQLRRSPLQADAFCSR